MMFIFFNFILAQLRDFFILFDLSLFSSLFDKIPDSIGNFYTTYINFLTDLIKNLKFILNFLLYKHYKNKIFIFRPHFKKYIKMKIGLICKNEHIILI